MNGNVGPGAEICRLTERDLRLFSLVFGSLGDNVGRHVVEEVRVELELGAVAMELGCGQTRFRRAGVAPPVAGRLAWLRDHRVHEHQSPSSNARGYERSGEPAQ